LKKSKGNYIVDADGQTLLDLCGTELNPLGYNHDAFVKVNNYNFKTMSIEIAQQGI
jgi:4-aminobutyrate aminotransferase-like enzyme